MRQRQRVDQSILDAHRFEPSPAPVLPSRRGGRQLQRRRANACRVPTRAEPHGPSSGGRLGHAPVRPRYPQRRPHAGRTRVAPSRRAPRGRVRRCLWQVGAVRRGATRPRCHSGAALHRRRAARARGRALCPTTAGGGGGDPGRAIGFGAGCRGRGPGRCRTDGQARATGDAGLQAAAVRRVRAGVPPRRCAGRGRLAALVGVRGPALRGDGAAEQRAADDGCRLPAGRLGRPATLWLCVPGHDRAPGLCRAGHHGPATAHAALAGAARPGLAPAGAAGDAPAYGHRHPDRPHVS